MEEKYKKTEKLQFQLCCLLAMIITMVGLAGTCLLLSGCQKRQKTENLHILSEKETAHTGETKKSESALKEVLQIPDKLEKEMKTIQLKKKVTAR